MTITVTPTPKLPWDFDVIAAVSYANRTWIVTARDHSYHPFIVHELCPDGSCEQGDYLETRSAAIDRMVARMGRWVALEKSA